MRPEVMDHAVLWLGRFGKLLYIPLPIPDERGLILKALARKKQLDATVDLIAIGKNESCKNLSGAGLADLMNDAVMAALEEKLDTRQVSDGTPLTIKTCAAKDLSISVRQVLPAFERELWSNVRGILLEFL